MGEAILIKPGGISNSDECTANRDDVLKGKTAVTHDSDDEPLEGTLELTGTAADSQVLNGQTYYNTDAKTKRTGGMPNQGAWTGRIGVNGKTVIPAGYHNGAGFVDQAITNRGAWTGSVPMNGRVTVPEGYHSGGGYVNGPSVTMRGGYGGFGNNRGNDAGNQRMWVQVPGGYYDENASVFLSWADIRNLTGLTADKIKKGQSIMGIIGSFQGFVDSPLYLFDKGTWNGLQTTGITTTWDGSTNGGSFWASSGSQIALWLGSGASTATGKGQARFNSVVDLTPYKYLKAEYADGGRATVYFGVSTNSNLQGFSYTAYTSFPGRSEGTYIIDISALSGSYYVYFGATDSVGQYDRTLVFNKVFLSNT